MTEQIEQPGKNALTHPCEALVENPDEPGQYVKCRLTALQQCTECTGWFCGTEVIDHLIFCVRCDGAFCQEHYAEHFASKVCEQREAA